MLLVRDNQAPLACSDKGFLGDQEAGVSVSP